MGSGHRDDGKLRPDTANDPKRRPLVTYMKTSTNEGFTVEDRGEGMYSRNIGVSEGRVSGSPQRGTGGQRRKSIISRGFTQPYNWESRGQS